MLPTSNLAARCRHNLRNFRSCRRSQKQENVLSYDHSEVCVVGFVQTAWDMASLSSSETLTLCWPFALACTPPMGSSPTHGRAFHPPPSCWSHERLLRKNHRRSTCPNHSLQGHRNMTSGNSQSLQHRRTRTIYIIHIGEMSVSL